MHTHTHTHAFIKQNIPIAYFEIEMIYVFNFPSPSMPKCFSHYNFFVITTLTYLYICS